MICFDMQDGVFNFRSVGILCQEGKVLLHKNTKDGYYSLPGGRVEPFEDTSATLVREFREEMGQAVTVGRLLVVHENFFQNRGKKYHELGFYYQVSFDGAAKIPTEGQFFSKELEKDGTPHLEFAWVELARVDVLPLCPAFMKARLVQPPKHMEHVVTHGL